MSNKVHDLPMPCRHAFSAMTHRVSSHSDGDYSAMAADPNRDEPHCSVWVCAADLEAGKRYVAYYTQRTPVVYDRAGVST
jgi:hypothetical protein